MSPDLTSRALEQLAALYGLQHSYHDIEGRLWTASPEAVLATLRALGASVSGPADLPEAVREYERRRWDRSVEPVIVVWGGGPLTFDIRLPEAASGGTAQIEIEVEGEKDRPRRIAFSLVDAETLSRAEEGGTTGILKRLVLPGGLPYGYHRMRISSKRAVSESLIVSAPERCPEPGGGARHWGAFLPLYAMRSEGSWGIGDFTDLQTFAVWVGSKGGHIAGTLPMLAAFLDVPFEFSPYVPASRLFWNEIFVDVRAIPELSESASARAIAESKETREAIAQLQAADLVDYARVMALKRKVLFELSRSVRHSGGAASAAIRKFVDERPEAVDYARFRAAGEKHRAPWQSWPQTGAGPASRAEGFDPEIEGYHLFVQWVAERQIAAAARGAAENGVGLYLDLPTGVHASGYDVFRHRDLFVQDVSAGAPPDTFFSRGQDWGFPPLHPSRQREQGYGYLIGVLRHHLRHARLLRIDHIMWLHRLFYIPRGMEAKDGVYVRYPADELQAVLCLEAHRSGAAIVGEDLGTVPNEVRADMARHAINRLYIAQMEIDGPGPAVLRDVPGECLASANTHDMPTFAGYCEGRDIQDRVDLGLMDAPGAVAERERRSARREALMQFLRDRGLLGSGDSLGEVLRSCLRFLAASRARFVLLNLEDLWLEARPQNVPGTVEDRDNWRRKARYSLEQLGGLSEVDAALREVDSLRSGSGGKIMDTGLKGSLLTEDDLHWFNEGTHFRLHDRLGAHPMTVDGARGTYFAVWAPNAERVFVMGDWNGWRNDERSLAPRGGSGIWEGFVPGVDPGHLYKYHVVSRFHGYRVDKADPFAVYNEVPPKTGSVVWDLAYAWGDENWMKERAARHTMQAPVAIYEVHLGSWRRVPEEKNRSLTYRELAAELPEYVRRLGFTHVEFMPVMEHPFYGSWGYQTTGYFAPTSRYGTPQDFMHLIDRLHQAGIGVILDWVPSHFPTDEHGLGYFDGTHLFEHADERQGFHPDWKSAIFNYGRNELRSFLISSAQFWLSAYHADGLRVDAVASMLYLDYSRKHGEWIPNPHGGRENLEAIAFLRRFNEEIYKEHPDVQTIAEESTSWPMVSRPTYLGGLGFGLKWDMGWMHDTLKFMAHNPVHRKHHHDMLTFRQLYAFHENFVLPLSHDEVVHGKGSLLGKMPGDEWQKFANLRLLMSYLYTQPGKKLLFMGCELGQSSEWNHDTSLDWHLTKDERHAGVQRLVADLNRLYRGEPALHELDASPSGFEWIDPSDGSQSCLSYLRKDRRGSPILVALNFTPVPRNHYRLGVPQGGTWKEIFNSDAKEYGGSGHGNLGGRVAAPRPSHGRSHSLTLTLPPLGAVLLKHAS